MRDYNPFRAVVGNRMPATARKILVTGANGNTPSLTITRLRKAGVEVRAVVRDKSKAEALAALGCEIVVRDLEDGTGLESLFDGVDAAFFATSMNAAADKHMSHLIQAAKGSNVHIVRLSAIGAAEDAPTANGRLHHASDEKLKASGLPFTILRPHFFMDNMAWAIPQIAGENRIYQGMADGRLGMIDARDIADVAATILLKGGHIGKTYTPTGPASISWADVAASVGRARGKPVEYVPVPVDAIRAGIRQMGMGDWAAEVLGDYHAAYGRGWGNFVTSDVEKVTGNPARSIDAFTKEVLAPMMK